MHVHFRQTEVHLLPTEPDSDGIGLMHGKRCLYWERMERKRDPVFSLEGFRNAQVLT